MNGKIKSNNSTLPLPDRDAIHDDRKDLYLAEQRLIANQAGRSKTYTLDEVERDLGLVDVEMRGNTVPGDLTLDKTIR